MMMMMMSSLATTLSLTV